MRSGIYSCYCTSSVVVPPVFGCVLLWLGIGCEPLWSPCRATRILSFCLVLRAIGAADGGSAGRCNWWHLLFGVLNIRADGDGGMALLHHNKSYIFSTGAFPGILNSQPPVCETVTLRNVLLLGAVSCVVCVCVHAGCGWVWLCDRSSSCYILNFTIFYILFYTLYLSFFLSFFLAFFLAIFPFLSPSRSLFLIVSRPLA